MSELGKGQAVFGNRFADAVGPSGHDPDRDTCRCVEYSPKRRRTPRIHFHADQQDTSSPGWHHLLDLVDQAAADGRTSFKMLPPAEPGYVATAHLGGPDLVQPVSL